MTRKIKINGQEKVSVTGIISYNQLNRSNSMKKIILMGLLIVSLFSCSLNDMFQDDIFKNKLGFELYWGDKIEITGSVGSNIYHAFRKVNQLASYRKEKNDHWQSPKQTILNGTGDCEDFAILLMNILYYNYNIKCSLILVDDRSRQIVEGGTVTHALIELPNGIQIEPETGWVADYTIGYRYSFDEVFNY